ncbi:MAG: Hsp20/alpha crystallin family protein [Exiguobacterium profundum]|nr:MAG: Hsp20/alpha crystallin family protein [Exiguobacterium profundum]
MVEKTQTGHLWPSLHDPLRMMGMRLADWLSLTTEASEKGGAYHIAMELPGVAEEDIHVSLEDGAVQIRGEKKTSRAEQGETWFFSERQFGSFSRSFRLPEDADPATVRAGLANGVLTVSVGKKAPAAAAPSRRVPINRG